MFLHCDSVININRLQDINKNSKFALHVNLISSKEERWKTKFQITNRYFSDINSIAYNTQKISDDFELI